MADRGRATEFEVCFSELVQRVLERDLGWKVLKNRVQPAGVQGGKDLHLVWEVDGRKYSWSFECKSHQSRPVRKEEVMPKVFDLWRSSHPIDVWCLALSDREPGTAVDEFLPWARETLNLPFRLTVLSPAENNLPELFACHPDLFEKVYPQRPRLTLSDATRQARIDAFGQFLLDESQAVLEPNVSAWTLVTPELPDRLGVYPDDEVSAREYLRGFAPSDWDSIAHGWAIERKEAEGPLLSAIRSGGPGISYHWQVGPPGEGKSTLARLVAWRLAGDAPEHYVLWTDAEFAETSPPLEWIDALPSGAAVSLFVDGTRQLRGVAALQRRHRDYRANDKKVTCVFVDRGVVFRRSRVQQELRRSRLQVKPIDVPGLEGAEVKDLISHLIEKEMLSEGSVEAAEARLRAGRDRTDPAAASRSWLLPTLMELTDPDQRGFEDILGGFLEQLAEIEHPSALALLLAAALAHASGAFLPEEEAKILVSDFPGGFDQAVAVLATEMVRQLGGSEDSRIPQHRLLTYSGVVADGLVHAALRDDRQREALDGTCRLLVKAVGRRDPNGRIPQERFDFLNRITHYLQDDLKSFKLAASWLEDWVKVDDPPIDFMTLQRLGECIQDWLRAELKENGATPLASELAADGRRAFEESLTVGRRVLTRNDDRPDPFKHRDLEKEELILFRSWAVLEDLIGLHLEGEMAHRRAAFLSTLGIAKGDVVSLSTLGYNLAHLGRFHNAAVLAGASGELGGDRGTLKRQKKMLAEKGVQIEGRCVDRVATVLSEIAEKVLLDGLDDSGWPYSRRERAVQLERALRRARRGLPNAEPLDGAISRLSAIAAADQSLSVGG